MVYRVAFLRTQSEQSAQDVRQEVFLNVFRYLEDFRNEAQIGTWIYKITLNVSYHHRLKQRREEEKIAAAGAAGHVGLGNRQEDPSVRLLAGRILGMADAETHRTLELLHVYGLTQDQVSDVFGLSRVAITKRMRKFRQEAAALEAASSRLMDR